MSRETAWVIWYRIPAVMAGSGAISRTDRLLIWAVGRELGFRASARNPNRLRDQIRANLARIIEAAVQAASAWGALPEEALMSAYERRTLVELARIWRANERRPARVETFEAWLERAQSANQDNGWREDLRMGEPHPQIARYCAPEFEIGRAPNARPKAWIEWLQATRTDVVPDASVGWAELRAVPRRGAEALRFAREAIARAYDHCGPDPFTEDEGMHIHVDAKGVDMRHVAAVFAAVESDLYRCVVGAHRYDTDQGRRYALAPSLHIERPTGRSHEWARAYAYGLWGNCDSRYLAVNPQSFAKHGTIEFRCFGVPPHAERTHALAYAWTAIIVAQALVETSRFFYDVFVRRGMAFTLSDVLEYHGLPRDTFPVDVEAETASQARARIDAIARHFGLEASA